MRFCRYSVELDVEMKCEVEKENVKSERINIVKTTLTVRSG